ncbi:TlpA family protein disulfide reductase [Sphingobacterium thalpophilum]|uniref:Thiol-disulfide oxidoreductase n=1 Tax=Sphingobacterium thalpophilum TaxID=259 RepID=A0A4V6Z300_9SPHI|nr:hypothetical protein [Sphingobacterium thalpophilum]VTR49328.1 Uncharacterised protein [Sphingobacterium thalpophilum]
MRTISNLASALLDKVVHRSQFSLTSGLLMLVFSFHMFSLSAQTPRKDSGADGSSEIKRLFIGDRVPDELWNLMLPVANHPEGKQYVQLKDFKERKLILIDCWATTCKSCLEGLPWIQQLQHEYPDVAFLLSTLEKDRANWYLKDNSYMLFSFIDTKHTLFTYFPYAWIPYYIWISEGKVVATTQATEVTKENIDKILNEGIAPARVRQDRVSFNIQDNFLEDRLIFRTPELQRSFTITGYLKDVLAQTRYRIGREGEPSFFATINAGPIDIFKSAIGIARPDLRKNNWFLLETKWRDKLLKVSSELYYADSTAHIYGVQFYSAARDKISLSKDLLHELNNYFGQKYGLEGQIEERVRKAYVVRDNRTSTSHMLSGKLVKKLPLYQLIDQLDYRSESDDNGIPWINRTDDFTRAVKVPDQWPDNLDGINAFLLPQGYKAALETIPMEVFVLRDIEEGGSNE